MSSKVLEDLKKWAALVMAWSSVFPALILFLDVWFAGKTRSRGIPGALANLMAMFLAIMVFFMVDRISKLFYETKEVRALKKAFLMAISMVITGISLPSTTSTYASPTDAFLMAFSFTVMSYSTLSVVWKRFNDAAERICAKTL
ncbi:MAG: hypothetical protein DRO05_05240 [Thermoproteota archaeon]|nr:MAG: hypothetical protein DRO05_05240 [Candidatus Korarchaeota archaeon]